MVEAVLQGRAIVMASGAPKTQDNDRGNQIEFGIIRSIGLSFTTRFSKYPTSYKA